MVLSNPIPMGTTSVGRGGAAATMDALATAAALEILKRGGNAVDAAVASSAALGVTEPLSCGIGGGGFMLIYLATEGRGITLDHRETAPRDFTATSLQDGDGLAIPFVERQTGGLCVGVPGTVLGWEEALRRFGRMNMGTVLEPAIRIAEEGFPVDVALHEQITSNLERFRPFASTRELLLTPQGKPLPVGSFLRNVSLADTYRLISRLGSKAFYQGPLVRTMLDTVQRPPLAEGNGINVRPGQLTMDDLSSYSVQIRPPIESTYRQFTIHGMGLPSSGGITVALTLNLLEGFSLGSLPRAMALHYYIEASRLAFADRDAYLGDSDTIEVPMHGLLTKTYAATRRREIRQTPSSSHVSAGALDRKGSSTTHLTVADRDGNIVSYTFSIGSIGGSGMVVPGHGFLLNSELTDFDAAPSHPNAPGAGKRPRSSMSPTIVFKDRKPVIALGAAGGIAIIASVLQPILGVLDFGLGLQEAIAAPRIFQHNTPVSLAESEFLHTPEANALTAMGHEFAQTPAMGEVTGIAFNRDGTILAAAEQTRRHGGSALVEEPAYDG